MIFEGVCIAVGGIVFLGVASGITIVRPTCRGLIERLGKYNRFAEPGFHFVIPLIEKIVSINITEQMVDAEKQEVITKDRLNAQVDAQVYFKVRADEKSVKDSQYNVNSYEYQIVNLARTTLRNIIGNLSYDDANSQRGKINDDLKVVLEREAKPWGIDILRTELKEIRPPENVQESMNKVIMAENEKKAALDFANASENKADGEKRAKIKMSEGVKQSRILEAEGAKEAAIKIAEGQAKAIELVNSAAEKYFIGNAQRLKQLEVAQASLENNTKIIVPAGSKIVNIIGEIGKEKILPIADEASSGESEEVNVSESSDRRRRR